MHQKKLFPSHPLPCQSCGEVLPGVEEYDDRDLTTKYCDRCLDNDGMLKSFDAILEMVAVGKAKSSGMSFKEAKSEAKKFLLTLPAWSEKPSEDWAVLEPEFESENG